MLAVVLFILLWAVIAFGLFFVAVRGGLGGARQALQGQAHRTQQMWGVMFIVIFIGFGVVIPVAILTGNHANASAQVGGLKLTAGEKQGRELFGERCSMCHTLSAANAIGKVGPNLDQIQPSDSLVLHTIQNGCLQNASGSNSNETCLGYGTMPADVIQGKQAQEVAAFVARVAGKE
jgi:mono/diheme cytochrome c family protein